VGGTAAAARPLDEMSTSAVALLETGALEGYMEKNPMSERRIQLELKDVSLLNRTSVAKPNEPEAATVQAHRRLVSCCKKDRRALTPLFITEAGDSAVCSENC
jgi:hypothetical protein